MQLFKPNSKKIKGLISAFLADEKAIEIMDTCALSDRATFLNSQIKIDVCQSDKNKLRIQISNNSKNGFTEFTKEYSI